MSWLLLLMIAAVSAGEWNAIEFKVWAIGLEDATVYVEKAEGYAARFTIVKQRSTLVCRSDGAQGTTDWADYLAATSGSLDEHRNAEWPSMSTMRGQKSNCDIQVFVRDGTPYVHVVGVNGNTPTTSGSAAEVNATIESRTSDGQLRKWGELLKQYSEGAGLSTL